MEDEKNLAVQFIKMERDHMLLCNMLYFLELSDAAHKFNQVSAESIDLKKAIDEKKK